MRLNRKRGVRRAALLGTAVAVLAALAAVAVVAAARGAMRSSAAPGVSGCFAFAVHMSRPTFPRGAAVTFAVSARNLTRHGCAGRPCGGVTPSYEVRDPSGRTIYRDGGAGVMCVGTAPPPQLIRPGATATWSVESWDGRTSWQGRCVPGDCHPTRPPAPPGTYRIVWHVEPGMSALSAWFHLD